MSRSHAAIIVNDEVRDDHEFLSLSDPTCKSLYPPYFDDAVHHIRRVRWQSLWGG
jgi:hypothetical protein